MKIPHRPPLNHLLKTFFRFAEGQTPASFRQDVATYAGELVIGVAPDAHTVTMPQAWQPYIKKVALYAYKVTDEDVQALQKAGFSEDDIFEVTLSAATGASQARLDMGLTLLQQVYES